MRIKVDNFNLEATLESGQVFGFRRNGEDGFFGVIGKTPVNLCQRGSALVISSPPDGGREISDIIRYFDLDRDLTPVYKILQEDPRLAKCYDVFKGLRLIRQDPWEALACFILSSNNNVKRIQGIWRNLSKNLGERVTDGDFSFPQARQIAGVHERTLRELGLGYRAPFLLHTACFVAANPSYLEAVHEAPYEGAKSRVLAFPGIGEKVADCVLLYGFQKYEAFPVDVWILRAMRKLYFRSRKVSEGKIHAFAQKRWGAHAGYVQQYLFHGARTGIISAQGEEK